MRELLSEEEVAALLKASGADATVEPSRLEQDEQAYPYDLLSPENAVVALLPVVQTAMDRFGHALRVELKDMLLEEIELVAEPVSIKDYDGFLGAQQSPCELNVIKIHPLGGPVLVVFERALTFLLVDAYFGGSGHRYSEQGASDLTLTERRMNRRLQAKAFRALEAAWKPYLSATVERLGSEMHPRFLTAVDPTESFVVGAVQVRLREASGRMHVGLPCAVFEPVRTALLSSDNGQRRSGDARAQRHLHEGIEQAQVQLRCVAGNVEIKLGELLAIEVGDFIAADVGSVALLQTEHVVLFRGRCGTLEGAQAFEVEECVGRVAGKSHKRAVGGSG